MDADDKPTKDEKPPVEGRDAEDERVDLRAVLTPRFDEKKARDMANRRLTDYNNAIMDRKDWENRLVEWEDAYYGRVPDKVFPWENCSNYWVPLTMTGVESYKPRLVEGVLGQYPPIVLTPTRGADEERKTTTEDFLNWQVLTELKLEEVVTESAHLFLIPGTVIAKTWWKIERIRRKMVRDFDGSVPLSTIMQSMFGSVQPVDVKSEGAGVFTAKLPGSFEGGGPLDVRLEINIVKDEIGTTTQVLVEREELIQRPQVDLIDPPDFFAPAKGGSDVQQLPWCQQRLWMSEGDLRMKARLGRFYDDAVEKVLTSGTPKGDESTMDAAAYRDSKDAAEGVEGRGPTNAKKSQYIVLEDYRREDIDDDGQEEEIVTWVCPDAPDILLGWDYLENVYAHGRRPFRVGKFLSIPFRFLGISFAEMIRGIQEEVNTIHNQRSDYGTVQNLPFFAYKASVAMPNISIKLRPGEGIPLENPQSDIVFPKWQGSTVWGMQEEQLLMQQLERLTGITDTSLGRQSNRVGATRTGKGTQMLLDESNLRYKSALSAFQRFWCGIFLDILSLDQEYLPPEKEFRVTGKSPAVVKMKDRTEIAGQYDLRVSANDATLNRQLMRQDATEVMQMLLNPALIQVGIVGKKGVRRSVVNALRARNYDPDMYLEVDQPALSPEEELMKFMRGEYVEPVPGENLPYHIAHHQLALQAPEIPAQVKMLIQKHLQATQQLQQMQQMAQQMQPPPQQQSGGQGEQGAPQPQQPNTGAPPPMMPNAPAQ